MSVLSVAGKVVAGAAAGSVLMVAGVAAVSLNSMVLTPGNVQVVNGFAPEQRAAKVPASVVRPQVRSPFTVLLLGSDSREGQGSGFGSADVFTGARSDTAMLMHVSEDRENVTVVSFPRDLRVDVPSCQGSAPVPYARFNVAFDVGGAACATSLVEQLTGVDVDHVVVVDFKGFRKVVDALGGLRVCLTEPVFDEKARLDLPAGWQTLGGRDALALARARKNLSDGSDLARIGRQQAILESAYRQVSADGVLTNPVSLYGFLSAVGDALTVSPSLSTTASQVSLAAEMAAVDVSSIRFVTVPWVPAGDGQTVALDDAAAEVLFEKLRSDSVGEKPKRSSGASRSSDDTAATFTSRDDSYATVVVPLDLCKGEGIL